MRQYYAKFLLDEDGAVTVDFVVLTAAIATLGLVVVSLFSDGTTGLAGEIETSINEMNAGQKGG